VNEASAAASLSALRDIHLPAPVSIWPPAPGVWLLAAILLLLAAAALLTVRARRRRLRARSWWELAADELNGIEAAFRSRHDAVELAIALSSLLRRSVLVRFPDKKAAALHGDAWFELLCADERTAQGDPTERTAPVGAAGPRPIHVVRELTETVYAGGRANIHADEWIAFVRGWIGAAA